VTVSGIDHLAPEMKIHSFQAGMPDAGFHIRFVRADINRYFINRFAID